jgi:hypothetical protein
MATIVKGKDGIWKYGDVQRSGYGFQLSSAQLLALNTTAVQVIPAPTLGGGYALWPLTLYMEMVAGTTAYTLNTSPTIQLEYTGKAVALILAPLTGLADATASTTKIMAAYPVQTVTSTTSSYVLAALNTAIANLGIEIKIATGSLTLGNGVINCFLEYDQIAIF